MFNIFPTDEPKQTIRLKRFFMGVSVYAMWILFALVGYFSGQLEIPKLVIPVVLVGIVFTNVYFYWTIRSGRNKKFGDPSLTLSQCMIAMSWAMVLMISTAESRGLMMMVYLMTMLFGVFGLNRGDTIKLAVFALAEYLFVLGMDRAFFPTRVNTAIDVLNVLVLGGVMMWIVFFGAHVNRLKRKLKARNDELQDALSEIGQIAMRDDLTKIYNRRYIMEALRFEKVRSDRTGITFSICIFDLDHFKTINDRYGHLAGDRVLSAFAERTRNELRCMDQLQQGKGLESFGRYGGEEFIVVLPHTRQEGARRCAERIRSATADEPFDGLFRVTLSVGLAEYRLGESIEEALRRADRAMYSAKQNGRNRVEPQFDTSTALPALDVPLGKNVVHGDFTRNRNLEKRKD